MHTLGISASFIPGAVVRLGISVIFALSCAHMLRDSSAHRSIVAAYRLLPVWAVPIVATLLALANGGVAVLLLPSTTAQPASLAGATLLLVYAAAMQINVSRGRTDIDCGCGGAPGQRISTSLVVRNMVLALMLFAAALCPSPGVFDVIGMVTLVGGAASFAALYFAASQLLANRAALAEAGA
jgi:hypothetical protein